MTKIEIYTSEVCPFCIKAKKLLESKNVEFIEYDILVDHKIKTQMIKRTKGANSVPQIFINNKYIGGCDDLYKLEEQNSLDDLLS